MKNKLTLIIITIIIAFNCVACTGGKDYQLTSRSHGSAQTAADYAQCVLNAGSSVEKAAQCLK